MLGIPAGYPGIAGRPLWFKLSRLSRGSRPYAHTAAVSRVSRGPFASHKELGAVVVAAGPVPWVDVA